MRRGVSLVAILVALALSAPRAGAHAFLDHAEPKVGATVAVAPAVVEAWFTRGLASAGSSLAVFDAAGQEIDRKDSRVDRDDVSLLTVSLPALPPGDYKVVWHATCRDSHHTTGTFAFRVAGPR